MAGLMLFTTYILEQNNHPFISMNANTKCMKDIKSHANKG